MAPLCLSKPPSPHEVKVSQALVPTNPSSLGLTASPGTVKAQKGQPSTGLEFAPGFPPLHCSQVFSTPGTLFARPPLPAEINTHGLIQHHFLYKVLLVKVLLEMLPCLFMKPLIYTLLVHNPLVL